MRVIERDVAHHYTHGSLEHSILSGLAAVGDTSKDAPVDQLGVVDEFHMGGRQATAEIAELLDLRPGLRVLDIGCGLGGTARFLSSRYGCVVTGVDITREYVDVGNSLNRQLGLDEHINLHVANATELAFENESFDRATLLHVGMNIPDKSQLCAEVARVITVGGLFAVYDVMRVGDAPLKYPVPWAQTEAISFLQSPDDYRSALGAAGFEITAEADRRQFALEFFRAMKARVAESGPPPLGLDILMGTDASAKIVNVLAGLESGCIAPVEMIARR